MPKSPVPKSPDFVISAINQHWSPGKKVLEIGCGPAFLREIYGKDYIGTDITDELYYPDLPRDVDFVCSADELLLDDASIDIVLIKSAFFLFPDHEKALQEVMRVLKPSGKLLIFDYNKRTQKGLQQKEGHTRYPCWTQWGLKRLVQKSGFKDVRNLLAEAYQPAGYKRLFRLLMQEARHNWAIVMGEK
jgi:SAM-dependent methyltransferase